MTKNENCIFYKQQTVATHVFCEIYLQHKLYQWNEIETNISVKKAGKYITKICFYLQLQGKSNTIKTLARYKAIIDQI